MKPACVLILLLLSLPARAQWETLFSGVNNTLLTVDALNDDTVWVGGTGGRVLRTTNGGQTWARAALLDPAAGITIIRAVNYRTAFVVARIPPGYRILKTTTAGATWELQHENPSGWCEGIHAFGPDTLVAVGGPSPFPGGYWDILRTTDGGNTWTAVDSSHSPLPRAHEWVTPWSTCSHGGSVWFTTSHTAATTEHARVFRSSNQGMDWSAVDLAVGANMSGYVAFADDENGLIVTDASVPRLGVYRSTDGGNTWDSVGAFGGQAYTITAVPGQAHLYFAGGHQGRISYTRDGGATWIHSPTGRSYDIYWMDAASNRVWAVGYNGEILRGTINLIVGKDDTAVETPRSLRLEQCYPNPFNPTTTVSYTLPRRLHVCLKIFDLLGREVKTLVDEVQDAGSRSTAWNSTNDAGREVESGVYFYTLRAAGFKQTGKAILLR